MYGNIKNCLKKEVDDIIKTNKKNKIIKRRITNLQKKIINEEEKSKRRIRNKRAQS